jgi:hypothetical protein
VISKPRKILALGDIHLPHQDDEAVACALGIARAWRPDLVVQVGDMCDAGQWSSHGRKSRREAKAVAWQQELALAGLLCDEIREASGGEVWWMLGNHEARAERELLALPWGEGIADLVSPEVVVGRSRPWLKIHPYGASPADWPEIAPGLVVVHGLDEGRHATAAHLQTCAPFSVLHGHTHRPVHVYRSVPCRTFEVGGYRLAQPHVLQHAITPGCLSDLQPGWLRGKPSGWAHGAALINVAADGTWSASLVAIQRGRAILPWGEEIRA